jgi:hypothetical protein
MVDIPLRSFCAVRVGYVTLHHVVSDIIFNYFPGLPFFGVLQLSEGTLNQLDVAAVFHSILFAYQRIIMDFLGEVPSSVITARTLHFVEKTIERASPTLANAEKMDVALRKLADLLVASGFVSKVDIEKEGERCILEIDGCAFAEHVHNMLKPKDVTCPWAIFAMSVVQKTSERRVKISLSEFTPLGSKTPIEFF